MQKRGQIYILAALIIGFVLFLLILPSNVVQQTLIESSFTELAQNFDRESAVFVNSLLQEDKPVGPAFLNFTLLFTSYSKTKNQDFGLLYTFEHEGNLYIGNYLHDDITFTFQGVPWTLPGCFKDVQASVSVVGLTVPIVANYALFQSCTKELAATIPNPPLDIVLHDPESGNIPLHFTVASGNPELIIISKEKYGQTRKMYVKGNFI